MSDTDPSTTSEPASEPSADAGPNCAVSTGSGLAACAVIFWLGMIGLCITTHGAFLAIAAVAWVCGVSINERNNAPNT